MSKTRNDKKMELLERKEQLFNLIKSYSEAGHGKWSRRQFLSSGFTSFSAAIMAPSLLSLISNSAWGAYDCGNAAAGMPIFLNIQLNGGPALFANFVACGSGGSRLSGGYADMAMPTNPRGVRYFGNGAPFLYTTPSGANPNPRVSGILEGLFDHLPTPDLSPAGNPDDNDGGWTKPNAYVTGTPGAGNIDIHDKTSFIAISAESIDDSAANKTDLSGVMLAAGITGTSLPHLLSGYGAFLSETLEEVPILQSAASIIPTAPMLLTHTPSGTNTANVLKNSMQLSGALASNNIPNPGKLMEAIENLSKLQIEALVNKPSSTESREIFKRLLACATEKNAFIINKGSDVDIYAGSYVGNNIAGKEKMADIWAKNKQAGATNAEMIAKGLTTTTMNGVLERTGTVLGACLAGFGQSATINLGGYDYHASFYTRASAQLKDRFLGDLLGRVLRSARAFNKKIFIYISTDGSVANGAGSNENSDWTGEYFKRGMHYILAYDPTLPNGQKTPMAGFTLTDDNKDASFQINHFAIADSQKVVNTANPIGNINAQELCASAVFLNYLNFAKKPNLIKNVPVVEDRLMASLPSSVGNIFDYYTRIKSS